MTLSDWLGVVGVSAGIVSIALAGVAIWLSLYFYNQAKGAEGAVSTALADIRAQTATLERITGRQLDRLTKFATQGRSEDPQFAEIMVIFRQLTAAALAPPQPAQLRDPVPDHVVAIYNVMYFSALANIGWQQQLPPVAERSPDHESIAGVVDESHQFFYAHLHMLDGVSKEVLQKAGVLERAEWVNRELKPIVRTSLASGV